MNERRLLILGGTAEAVSLSARASLLPGLQVVTSLAGRTRAPTLPEGELRVGGFGGSGGLRNYLAAETIDLVVDATHPFATQISRHAVEACARQGVPRLLLARPPRTREAGDTWIEVADEAEAAARLPDLGQRVFLALGRQNLAAFAGLPGTWFLVRLIEAPAGPLPLADYEAIAGRGPFPVADEHTLLEAHRIDCLVSRQSGGDATYGKIAAARARALPVVMIRRPPTPAGESVADVERAVDWIEARLES